MTAELLKISHGNIFAQQNYFQVFPDNPSGEFVAYTASPDGPFEGNKGPAEVWICTYDGKDHRKIGNVDYAEQHCGARPTWITDTRLAFADSKNVHIVDIESGAEQVLKGTIDNYCPINEKILFPYTVGHDWRNLGLESGIYCLDVNTGNLELLVPMKNLARFSPLDTSTYDSGTWFVSHAYWSPGGSKIAFVVFHGDSPEGCIFLADPDGSNVEMFGSKFMHWTFFDDYSFFGHDDRDKKDTYLRRWDFDGNIIEDLAGPGCHGTISPDRQWIVTESWYNSDPIEIFLYRRGENVPRKILGKQSGNWHLHTHVHPAFSRDGQRVYFNYNALGGPGSQMYMCDLSELIKG